MNYEQLKWEITTTGNKVELLENHVEIEELYGGFGQGQRILTVPQIAKLHVDDPENKKEIQTKIKRINELINNNINNFIDNIDIIDLNNFEIDLSFFTNKNIYSQAQIGNSKKLYILSLSGYCKLFNLFRNKNVNDKKEVLEKYFKEDDTDIYNIVYKEIEFRNKLEHSLTIILINILKTAWNIDDYTLNKIIENKEYLPSHQYAICNGKYQIDFFWEKFKIIVEFDENRHKYNRDKDNNRMNEIIQYLSLKDGDCGYNEDGILVNQFDYPINVDNCEYTILRISEDNENGINEVAGCVLGKIFSVC